jgi:hypothetical protein
MPPKLNGGGVIILYAARPVRNSTEGNTTQKGDVSNRARCLLCTFTIDKPLPKKVSLYCLLSHIYPPEAD